MTVTSNIGAKQLMEEIATRASFQLIEAIKRHHKGNDNLILRDIKLLHSNTSQNELPKYLKEEIEKITFAMFGYINSNGYVLVPRDKKG